jgi:anaerobic selenocysteine-containing dehydrogenase
LTRHGPIGCRPVFERLTERCCAWPANRVEAVTGVPTAQLMAAADLIADARFLLTLTTAKWPQYCHSQQRHQPSLRLSLRDRAPPTYTRG